ncbi:MAG TPA: PadR family transcriptional regulator [Pyrinomonadaceae bacterium]|jgi:Predicted transcriptional regulators|nr:PadR family transcriptional regulator [Pyrinomonadaceae bacterium]
MAIAVKQGNKKARKSLQPANQTRLTIPDLVILSLLAERPMHGYEVNVTLEDRKIRDWAPVSRPQIYYSLDKLTKLRLIRTLADDSPSAGPERRVFETTATGRDRLADALEGKHWVIERVHQPFLIWLALSWQARPRAFRKQLNSRKKFLEERLAEEHATLDDVMTEVGHPYHEAVWMLQLIIQQMETELRWVSRILADADKRAPARKEKKR